MERWLGLITNYERLITNWKEECSKAGAVLEERKIENRRMFQSGSFGTRC